MIDNTAEAREAISHWFATSKVEPLGAGHIHDTYLVRESDQRWVLQRVNQIVFTRPRQVMEQTQRLLECWGQQKVYAYPVFVANLSGETYVELDTGFWRLWSFLPGLTIEKPDSFQQARAAGLAFARLQVALQGLDAPRLGETIDNFLQLSHYLRAFESVEEKASTSSRKLIDAYRDIGRGLEEANCHIHGDCKIDNLLFAKDHTTVVAILDFDTAMYGHRAWDFGDLARSLATSRGGVDVDLYRGALTGFLEGGVKLTKAEAVAAPIYISLMLGIRFLTDHYSQAGYFKTTFPGENLRRAEFQFSLVEQWRAKAADLEKLATGICSD
jgi:Ser/Thr protein kinase RdoA (MazF antagonist)